MPIFHQFVPIKDDKKENVTKHPKQVRCKEKRTNYVGLIRRFLNLQTCLFVLVSDYADMKIEAGLMSQPP